MRTRGDDFSDALSGGDQAAGKYRREIVASRLVEFSSFRRWELPDRDGLSSQQGFIRREIDPTAKDSVGGNAVAFAQDDKIAPHNIVPGNAPVNAITDDEGPGTRQVPQGVQRALRSL